MTTLQLLLRLAASSGDAMHSYEEAWLEHVARPYAAHLSEVLRRDLELRGEAFVHVGWDDALQAPTHERIDPSEILPSLPNVGTGQRFKYAGFDGPQPTLVEPCPACGAPAMHHCNERGAPIDSPHEARRLAAGTA